MATFAGPADIIHWEQSFNCFDPPPYEQFVRQAYFITENNIYKPLIVYSGSGTANWYY